jgi:hypothetical protein
MQRTGRMAITLRPAASRRYSASAFVDAFDPLQRVESGGGFTDAGYGI